MRWRATFGVAAWLALATASPGGATDFRIGVAVPLSGPDSVFGVQVKLGVDQAVADMNAMGGFVGQRGVVDPRDDGGDPKKAADLARAFIASKTSVVVGNVSSAATIPATAILADAGILAITPSALAPAVTDRELNTVFRICGRDDQQAEVVARYILARRFARVAVVYDRTSDGKEMADGVRKVLASAGLHDSLYASLDKGARDFGSLVGRIKASGAQAVVFSGSATEGGLLARQLRDANLHATFIGGTGIASDEFATQAGAATEGALLVVPQDPKSRPSATDLLRRLRAKGVEPDALVFYAYAAVQIVRQAAEAAHSLDPTMLAATMRGGRTFKTVLGDLAFDTKGDPTSSDLAIYIWHKGATGRMTYDDRAKT